MTRVVSRLDGVKGVPLSKKKRTSSTFGDWQVLILNIGQPLPPFEKWEKLYLSLPNRTPVRFGNLDRAKDAAYSFARHAYPPVGDIYIVRFNTTEFEYTAFKPVF